MNDERYPDGKLNVHDEGALQMAIGTEQGCVHIEFPKLVKWIALPPDMAIDVAEILIRHARELGCTKPLDILVERHVHQWEPRCQRDGAGDVINDWHECVHCGARQ